MISVLEGFPTSEDKAAPSNNANKLFLSIEDKTDYLVKVRFTLPEQKRTLLKNCS
jgi:hypothetical protein